VEQDDWRQWLDAATNLTPGQREALHSAIASSVLEGWTPDRRAVELLAQFGSGTITFAEYRAVVLREAAVGRPSHRQSSMK
jgi:hypothetical protein